MQTNFFDAITIVATLIFSSSVFAQVDGNILNGVANTSGYEIIESINMDKDLSTFANLLALSGSNLSLALTTELHTLLVSTNNDFCKMTIKPLVELTNPKNKTKLIKFTNDHFLTTKCTTREFKNADIIGTGNNIQIEIHQDDYYLSFESAKVLKANIKSNKGIIL